MRPWMTAAAAGGEAGRAAVTRFNLAVLPREAAYEFVAFCAVNPAACSIVAIGDAGDPVLRDLGDADLRRAADSYDILVDGRLSRRVGDLAETWRDDLVGVAIGCSLALDTLLLEQGIVPKHLRLRRRVPVLRTGRRARAVGRFAADLMVTMRVFADREVARVCQASARFPALHGGPIHVGAIEGLGLNGPVAPVLGEYVPVEAGETAVYWGCGVTVGAALAQARLPLAIVNTDAHLCASTVPLASLSVM